MTLHVLTDLNELTTDDNKAVQHVAVHAALVFFMVTAGFDLGIILQKFNAKSSLHL
jgi:hypothetical protein